MFLAIVMAIMSKYVLSFKIGASKFLYHVTPGRTYESIVLTYVANVIIACGLWVFAGVWMIPDLKILEFAGLSLVVKVIRLQHLGSLGQLLLAILKELQWSWSQAQAYTE